MRIKEIAIIIAGALLFTNIQFAFAQSLEERIAECPSDRVIKTKTINAIYVSYIEEDVAEIPSELILKKGNKEIRIVADSEDIEKYLGNVKKGEYISVTYNIVHGWLGDGCDKYAKFVRAAQIK